MKLRLHDSREVLRGRPLRDWDLPGGMVSPEPPFHQRLRAALIPIASTEQLAGRFRVEVLRVKTLRVGDKS